MTSNEALGKIRNLLFGKTTFAALKTVEGVELKVEGDVELEKEIYIITPDGEIPAPEGDVELEDGMKLRIKDGKVEKIDYTKVEEEVMEEHEEKVEEEVKVEEDLGDEEKVEMVSAELIDGTIVETDGDLVVGAELYVTTEEGRTQAPDGSHETVDGNIVVVEDGIITEISEKVVVEEDVEVEASFDEMLELFTEGFNHLNNELNLMKERYETLSENFNRFSAEPVTERKYMNEYVESMKKNRFSKLEQLAALKHKNK